jgi:hypothetical protein
MVENSSTINITITNYETLYDVEMFLGTISVLPLLEAM